MIIHDPTTEFCEIQEEAAGAYRVVNTMTEDQVRYALWCTLVILFGGPESNAPAVMDSYSHELSAPRRMQEAQLILTEIGVSRSHPEAVERLRKAVLESLATE